MRSSLLIASFVLGALANPRVQFYSILEKRQSSSPSPTECSTPCSNFVSGASACTDDKCLCTTTNMQNLSACLQCAANTAGEQQQLQQSLDQVTNDCNSEEFKVPSGTITGSSGGSTPTPTAGSKGGALGIDIPQAFVATILAGACLAIAVL